MGTVAAYTTGFYYDQLTIDQQFAYRKIASAISGYSESVETGIADNNIHSIRSAIRYDNPEFFYWKTIWPDESNRAPKGKMFLSYALMNAEVTQKRVQQLRDARRQILDDLAGGETVSAKEMLGRVYEYLTETVTFAESELQKPEESPWIADIQGPLLRGRSICLGIAQTVNFFCQALRIPSLIVTGEADLAGFRCSHGWNLVCLDGEYFHVDVTADICDLECEQGKYFLLKDEELEGRSWNRELYPVTGKKEDL